MARRKHAKTNQDIVVFLALQEEYQVFRKTFGTPMCTSEDDTLALTYDFFEIPNSSGSRTWRIVSTCAGAMGQSRSAAIATHLMKEFSPDSMVVVGISGSLNKDVLLGDIVVPKVVENYLSLAAAVPGQDNWRLETSGTPFQADSRLRNKIQNMMNNLPDAWRDWQNEAVASQHGSPQVTPAVRDGLVHSAPMVFAEDVNLASGDILGKAKEFVEWLRAVDRKFTAIDMESAGVFEGLALQAKHNTRFLSVRGISDFADERKQRLDNQGGGSFRKYAISNAVSFLKAAIVSDLFDCTNNRTASLAVPKPKLKTAFTDFLEDTDIELQNSHKAKLLLSDIYVFPDLTRLNQLTNKEQPFHYGSKNLGDTTTIDPVTIVYGTEQAGKTSLAKALIQLYVKQGVIASYISAQKVRNKEFSKLVSRLLSEQYLNVSAQTLSERVTPKVALVDDFQEIGLNKKGQAEFLSFLRKMFDRVVIISDLSLKLQDADYITLAEFPEYQIIPFGHVLRADLVDRWVCAGQEDNILDVNRHRRTDELITHLSSIVSKNLVPSKPIYILTILQIFETTKPSDVNLTSYGYCYHHIVMQSFIKHGVHPRQIDALVNILSELAYAIYKAGGYSLTRSGYFEFENSYFKKYVSTFGRNMLHTLEEIGIIVNDGEKTYFKYRFIYYFYCAKFLADNYSDDNVSSEVALMCQQMYLDRHAHIVIFLTHHTKDQALIDDILLNTMMRFSGVKEATLDTNDTIHFREYEKLIPKLVLEERQVEKERRRLAAARDMVESRTPARSCEGDPDKDDELYRRGVLDPRSFLAEARSCLRSLDIIGQILRNRYGSFSRVQLQQLAEEAINAALRLLGRYLNLSSEYKEDIEEAIRASIREHIGENDKAIETKARKIFGSVCYWVTSAALERVSGAIGCAELDEIFHAIADTNKNSLAVRLIHLSIRLQTQKKLPKDQVSALYSDLSEELLGRRLLRHMLLRFVYRNPVNYADKQWISEATGLPMRFQSTLTMKRVS